MDSMRPIISADARAFKFRKEDDWLYAVVEVNGKPKDLGYIADLSERRSFVEAVANLYAAKGHEGQMSLTLSKAGNVECLAGGEASTLAESPTTRRLHRVATTYFGMKSEIAALPGVGIKRVAGHNHCYANAMLHLFFQKYAEWLKAHQAEFLELSNAKTPEDKFLYRLALLYREYQRGGPVEAVLVRNLLVAVDELRDQESGKKGPIPEKDRFSNFTREHDPQDLWFYFVQFLAKHDDFPQDDAGNGVHPFFTARPAKEGQTVAESIEAEIGIFQILGAATIRTPTVCVPYDHEHKRPMARIEEEMVIETKEGPAHYRLIGATRFVDGPHYVAYVFNEEERSYVKINDSRISPAESNFTDYLSQQAGALLQYKLQYVVDLDSID